MCVSARARVCVRARACDRYLGKEALLDPEARYELRDTGQTHIHASTHARTRARTHTTYTHHTHTTMTLRRSLTIYLSRSLSHFSLACALIQFRDTNLLPPYPLCSVSFTQLSYYTKPTVSPLLSRARTLAPGLSSLSQTHCTGAAPGCRRHSLVR